MDESRKKYWFADDSEALADNLMGRHSRWLQYGTNPIVQSWIRNSVAYYSTLIEPNDWQSALGYVGDQGELIKCVIPHARSLVRQVVSLVTKQRLAFKCIAESSGSDVAKETRLGNAIVEQKIVREQELDRKSEFVAESALVHGMGFFKLLWRTDRGKPFVAPEENDGKIIFDGDLEISTPLIWDVIFDTRVQDPKDRLWVETRTIKNRFDLIADFPDLADHILALPRINETHTFRTGQYQSADSEDLVYVYEAVHIPTSALPKGRSFIYSDRNTVYFDGKYEEEALNVIFIVPEPIIGTGYGYPLLSSLLPAQEMYDHSISAIATNQAMGAVQSVTCPRTSNIGVQNIQGMNFILFDPANAEGGGKPEALQLTHSAPETFKFADNLLSNMVQLSNLNSAVRGSPPPGVTSGTAIATLTANSLEFLNSTSKALQLGLEKTVWMALRTYMQYCKIPKLYADVGRNGQAFSKEFSGKDLQTLKQVKMTVVNPLMNTLAGRADTAEKLLGTGLIKSVQEYFSIIDGAPVEQMYEVELSENDLVQAENQALMEGVAVPVLVTDNHPDHMMHHAMLLNDPMIRMNNANVKVIFDHIIEHNEQAKSADPFLTAMIRTGKMPQMGPPPPSGPPPGPPHNGPPPMPPPGQGEAPHNTLPPGKSLFGGLGPKEARIAKPAKDNLGEIR